jgi:hypothetical protein
MSAKRCMGGGTRTDSDSIVGAMTTRGFHTS